MRLSRVALLVALALSGCASGGRAAAPDAAQGAAQRMARQAQREAAASRAPATPVPLPPGLGPDVLSPRATDARARLALDAALAQFVGPPAASPVPPTPPGDQQARDAALRHYVKGRDAALRGHFFVAITELEKAQAIDPAATEVLRQLARCYGEVDNDTKAAAYFERLLRVLPVDEEALLQLGGIAFNRRDFARAASYLARLRLAESARDDDLAAGLLADHMLATAFRELGFDRAFIDLAVETSQRVEGSEGAALMDRWDKLYRQRSELWQSVGDARCRLGEYAAALDAYTRCAALPNSQPESLHPRVIYANLCLGRRLSAQAALLEALEGPRPAGEQEIRLCAYVAENAGEVELLGQAIIDLQRERPDDPTLVRAAAVLLPREEALRLLRAFLHHRPQDLGVFSQLLGWLAEHDERSAVGLAVALCEDRPALAWDYADRLAMAAPSPSSLLSAAATLPPTPARALVQARLLMYMGAPGRAWTVLSEALDRFPGDEELLLTRLDLAGRLNEASLLDEANSTVEGFRDRRAVLARARALRALGQTEDAIAAATEAAELDANSPDAQVELVLSHLTHAQQLEDADQRRWHLQQAAEAGQQALTIDPTCEEAYSLLFLLYAPNTVLADRDAVLDLRRRLDESLPASALAARLEALEIRRDGQYRRGLERLLSAWEGDPSQTQCLETAVMVWAQLGREDEAMAWFEEQLSSRPADPALLEHWVAIKVRTDQRDDAVVRLKGVLSSEPQHDAARGLLENVYRSQGQHELAVALAEDRLLTRPQGIGRELELAAAYADAGMDADAEARLAWILQRADDARYDQLVNALIVLNRMTDHDPRYAEMSLTFADRTVGRFPESPLVVYGYGLRALARMGPLDQRFDELADRAVRFARGASGSSQTTAELWRALAQDLVDAGRPEAAGRAARARLLADMPLEPGARALLANVAIVADAATGNAAATCALVQALAVRGWLPVMPGMDREPSVADVLYRASNYYTLFGKDSGAEQLLRETIRLEPDHAMALNNLGYTRLEMGFSDAETAAWIERAARLAPDDGNVLDTLGWLRYKSGHFDEGDPPGALRLIRESARLSEQEQGVPSVEVLDHLGDTLWRLGDVQGAVENWRHVTEILEDPEMRDRLQQGYETGQARAWGLRVGDAAEMYEREYGAVLKRARQKLAEVERGGVPPVAATFEEMSQTPAAPAVQPAAPAEELEGMRGMGNGRP